jgi:hypothetical protein
VFQFGQIVSEAGFDSEDSLQAPIDHAVNVGVSPDEAEQLALELTVELEGVLRGR